MMKMSARAGVLWNVLVLAALAVPAQGAVIDQVKSKVDAIKNETAAIKSKTTDLQARTKELASTASAQILETVAIKDALAPLFGLKDRFGEMEFDPAALLDGVDFEELSAKMEEMKQRRQELKDRLNDPDLESFRADLLGLLADINEVVAEDGVVQATPFQSLAEKAPLPVLALLKAGAEPLLAPLEESIGSARESMDKLKEIGLLDMLQSRGPADPARVCNAVNLVGTDSAWLFLWKHEGYLETVERNWEKAAAHVKKGEKVSQELYPDVGLHGYLKFGMPKTMVAESMADANGLKGGIEWQKRKTERLKELVERMHGNPDLCSILLPAS